MVTIWLHWRLRRHYWRTMVVTGDVASGTSCGWLWLCSCLLRWQYASSARSGFATRWLMLSVVEDNQLWCVSLTVACDFAQQWWLTRFKSSCFFLLRWCLYRWWWLPLALRHGSGGCTRSAGVLTWSLSGNGALQAPIWFAAVAEIAWAMFPGVVSLCRESFFSSESWCSAYTRGMLMAIFAHGEQEACVEGPCLDTIWGNLNNLNGGGRRCYTRDCGGFVGFCGGPF